MIVSLLSLLLYPLMVLYWEDRKTHTRTKLWKSKLLAG